MASKAVKKVAVIGAGQMGLGIAYVAALHAKIPVTLHDPSPTVLAKALPFLRLTLQRPLSKSVITQDQLDETLSLITPTLGDGSGLSSDHEVISQDTDLVVEAIPEIPELKLGLFERLASVVGRETILGSNTSSISITKLAGAAERGRRNASREVEDGDGLASKRVVGIHFFNPVPQMRLVEIIPGLQTSTDTIERARAFGASCNKEVTFSKDSPGFIANAILMPMINEAILTLEKGVATAKDIDTTFKLGMAHPMGPLALADLIGLDTCLSIQRVLFEQNGDSKYRPSGLLVRMVDAGWVGRKVGKGFYDYPSK